MKTDVECVAWKFQNTDCKQGAVKKKKIKASDSLSN